MWGIKEELTKWRKCVVKPRIRDRRRDATRKERSRLNLPGKPAKENNSGEDQGEQNAPFNPLLANTRRRVMKPTSNFCQKTEEISVSIDKYSNLAKIKKHIGTRSIPKSKYYLSEETAYSSMTQELEVFKPGLRKKRLCKFFK